MQPPKSGWGRFRRSGELPGEPLSEQPATPAPKTETAPTSQAANQSGDMVVTHTPKQDAAGPTTDSGPAPGGWAAQQVAEELKQAETSKPAAEEKEKAAHSEKDNEANALKTKIHRRLLEEMDMRSIQELEPKQLRTQIKAAVNQLLTEENALLTQTERERLVDEIIDETMGLGPLETLLRNEDITEIMINGAKTVYIERKGKLTLSDCKFKDDLHLMQIIDRIVSRVGRRVDESTPLCDARLQDGSRVNVIIPPLALDGPTVTIRKFAKDPYGIQDLINFGSLNPMSAELLKACVFAHLNIIISGGTGSGKTTLLNVTSSFIPNGERIVTVEDSAELQLQQDHVVRLETRPANIEGKGEITMRDLVKNCLRMRPERIVVGEVRSGEALDMLQAMNTGHDGSLTTVHANNPRDAVRRLETLVMMAGYDLPQRAIREQIASAVDQSSKPAASPTVAARLPASLGKSCGDGRRSGANAGSLQVLSGRGR
ncbi:MAG: ATPase, T2SS/T4P/T4SS family [Vampirovibrionales bacterium]